MIAATENTEFHGKKLKKEQKIFLKVFFHCFTRIPCFSVSSVANEFQSFTV